MSAIELRHVYGPVPSRRLGRSLGVDLVPFKTCTYDCVYCQLGRTTDLTTARREYVPIDDVLEQLAEKLGVAATPDYVSLAGSGEPTLHSQIGELITGIKRLTRIPVAVLTNGSLLGRREIQNALMEADLVLPSLDAGDAELFRLVNRPHGHIAFADMVDGLASFRARFAKPVWLEVMLLAGITGIPSEVEKMVTIARRIRPHRVHLNTVTRPPCEAFAWPVPPESMAVFARRFGRGARVVSERRIRRAPPSAAVTDGEILALLSRRPCTARGIAEGLGLHIGEVGKRLDILAGAGRIISVRKDGAIFFDSVRECGSRRTYPRVEGPNGTS